MTAMPKYAKSKSTCVTEPARATPEVKPLEIGPFATCFHVKCSDCRKRGFPGGTTGKESTCQCRRPGFNLGVRKIPWSRKQQPTPVFLSGKSQGQMSLAGYSPRVTKDLDTT